MDLRTLQEIIDELKADIQRRNPAIADWSPLSVNLTLAQAYSKQIYDLERLIQTTADSLWVNTATGDDLDRLVVDRLPAGRNSGTKATGDLMFSRSSPVAADITIPSGTMCAQPNPDGTPVYFMTTQDVILASGETKVTATAQAYLVGISGNAPANTITSIIDTISGIEAVTNQLAFDGGTDEESDDALRKRYIYSVNIPGRATESMIEQHLIDLESVSEAKVFTKLPGTITIVVDTDSGIINPDSAIEDTIIDNMAAGIISQGVVGATVVSGVHNVNMGTCAGGYVYVVVNTVPSESENIKISYVNQSNEPKSSREVTIMAGTVIGTSIKVPLAASDDRCTKITNIIYTGSGSYAFLMGLGAYPYLYNLPLPVIVNVEIVIVESATPENSLTDNIAKSVTDFLNSLQIGEKVEFADVVRYIYIDYETTREFSGIDNIDSVHIKSGEDISISQFGTEIVIGDQELVHAGAVNVSTA